jgi:hypothetical protein
LAPDYPFGASEDLIARSTAATIDLWGTDAYGYSVYTGTEPGSDPAPWGRLSRQTGTPDVAIEMDRIYNETDVRGAMPSIAAPVLLLARDNDREALTYLATLLRQPQIRLFPGADELKVDEQPAVLDAIQEFVGISPAAPELDTVLSTVLFTDVVGSTQKQAELGDRRYKGLIERHHAIVRDALERWRGLESSTAGDGFYATFNGPARAIRCAMEVAYRVIDLGIEIRAGVHTGECELMDGKISGLTVSIGARVAASRPLRSVDLTDGERPRRGIGSHLRRRWRTRAQGCPRPLAPLPGDGLTLAGSSGPQKMAKRLEAMLP